MQPNPFILADLASPLRLEYLSIPAAALLFAVLATLVIWLGVRSLGWMGTTRKWVAISLRLSLIWVLVLLLAGAHWVRQNHDLQVIVLRDVSTSTGSVIPPAGKSLTRAVDELIQFDCRNKPAGDAIGVVDFSADAQIESLPDDHLHLDSRPIHNIRDGTDIASALRLGLASFRPDAMRRLVLVSDGNATQGDTDSAIATAASMGIPIDVLPLRYNVRRDVLVDRIIAPTCKRRGEPFSIDVILRSKSIAPVAGMLSVTQNNQPMQATHVELRTGASRVPIKVPAASQPGLMEFRVAFQADRAADDAIAANNSAESFTFIKGPSQILYVDNTSSEKSVSASMTASNEPSRDFPTPSPIGVRASSGIALIEALRAHSIEISSQNHISPDQFPTRLIDLQAYDAVVLANVPKGPGGLSTEQDHLLAHYVRDLGGGLLVIGGPESFGPGNWQGSEVEKVLPVNCEIPAERVTPAGALVIVLDHSGSMCEPMNAAADRTKQQVASESAILALNTLQKDDVVGVLGFAANPTWVVDLSANSDPEKSARKIEAIHAVEGTNICPALEEACSALQNLHADDIAVRRILLVTDGVSESGDYDRLLARLQSAGIKLSTIAIGSGADQRLLRSLARQGGGAMYAVDSASQLRQVFIREARMLRRQLIQEPAGGIELVQNLGYQSDQNPNSSQYEIPPLSGMVLTALKADPMVRAPILTAGRYHDPVFAHWNVGLGHAAVFTSDATSRWASRWIATPAFGKFWAEAIRNVSRPTMSEQFDLHFSPDGQHTKLTVEAVNPSGAGAAFLSFTGRLAGPDESISEISLHQTGPGRYETEIDTSASGIYAASIQYRGAGGASGSLLAGLCMPASVELRDMQSNERHLTQIAARTGGRLLSPLDRAASAGLFDREGLSPSIRAQPISDVLLCILIGMLVTDVAVRRIHWDWTAVKHWATISVAAVEGFTTPRKVNAEPTLTALRKIRCESSRDRVGDMKLITIASSSPPSENHAHASAVGVSSLSNLKMAKQRALEEIRQKEQGRIS